jgi:hypothetical protein
MRRRICKQTATEVVGFMNRKVNITGKLPERTVFGVWSLTFACVLFVGGAALAEQNAASAPQPTDAPIATEDVRGAADRLGQALSTINPAQWKAPGEVKGQTQSDIASIQRNLKTTLPDLLDQAKVDPHKVAPAFAVYRNLSALYDVLLRIAETSTLAGSQQDGATLDNELRRMDAARKSLGASIFDAATAHDAELLQLRATNSRMASQLAAVQAPPKKVVVNDGPAATTPAKKKKKPTAAAPPPPAK